jgi:hypothetical protein
MKMSLTAASLKRFSATCGVIGLITALLLKLVDVGFDAALPFTAGLFPLDSKVRFRTLDYDAVANINTFGFRGTQQELRSGQIVVVGDSFTFGLGGTDEEIWPYLLEQNLRRSSDGRNVYNLGTPGTDTLFHLQVARESLAMQPSVIILCVLLGDDLQQVFEARDRSALAPRSGLARAIDTTKDVIKGAFPGLFKLFRRIKYGKPPNDEAGAAEPQKISESFSDEKLEELRERTAHFPPELRQAVFDGEVNLGLFQFADEYPDRSWKFWADLTRDDAKALRDARFIEGEIAQLADEMRDYGGRLVVFAMPGGEFVKSQFTASYRLYGASIPDENLTTLVPEQRLREMAVRAGAAFVPSLNEFRGLTDADPFFPTDGHLNAAGNALVARILFEHLAVKPEL